LPGTRIKNSLDVFSEPGWLAGAFGEAGILAAKWRDEKGASTAEVRDNIK
jgi:hypothetical protein